MKNFKWEFNQEKQFDVYYLESAGVPVELIAFWVEGFRYMIEEHGRSVTAAGEQ